jgi:hypothetical protein
MTTPHPPSASAAAEKPAWKVRWLDYQTGEERAEFCHSESAAREYPHSGSTILSVTEYRPLSSWQRAQSAPPRARELRCACDDVRMRPVSAAPGSARVPVLQSAAHDTRPSVSSTHLRAG